MATDHFTNLTRRQETLSTLELVVTGELGDHREEWDALVDRQPLPTHYLRSWWLSAGTQGEPVYILVKEGERLRGGLALEQDEWHGITRLRTMATALWPTHFDLLAEPDFEAAVVDAIATWLRTLDSCILDLRGLRSDSRLRDLIPGDVTETSHQAAYAARLGGGLEGFLASISGSLRRDIRRVTRRLEESGYRMRVVPEGETDLAMKALRRLQELQFGSRSALLPVFDRLARAVGDAARSDDALLFEMRNPSGEVVAVDLWLIAGRRAEGFAHGRAPNAPSGAGNSLIAFAIDRAGPHIEELDLGTHHGEWKKRWASIERRSVDVRATVGGRAKAIQSLVDGMVTVRRRLRRLRG